MAYLDDHFDAAIIGAGFFGAVLADYLVSLPTIKSIAIFEKEGTPLARSSANNQARIHQGFHYPRSIETAASSMRSYEKFKSKWPSAVFSDFEHFYAVSKFGSKVSGKQFEATMSAIGAPFISIKGNISKNLFDMNLIEKIYRVKEEAFNYLELRTWAQEVLSNRKITVFFNAEVNEVEQTARDRRIKFNLGSSVSARYIFNVSYSGIDKIDGLSEELKETVFHQLTEMPLVETPGDLRNLAITVMDGPFFSLMPYPSVPNSSTLSHVRYTPRNPHINTEESRTVEFQISQILRESDSTFELMKRDAARYVPQISDLKPISQIVETKTLLKRSTNRDSRPILFMRHKLENTYSILGGKIDNVFDMLERIREEKIR